MIEQLSGTAIQIILAAIAGGGLVKALDVLAQRRKVGADTEVTLSAEARAWVGIFQAEIEALRLRVSHLEAQNEGKDVKIRELTVSNRGKDEMIRELRATIEGLGG